MSEFLRSFARLVSELQHSADNKQLNVLLKANNGKKLTFISMFGSFAQIGAAVYTDFSRLGIIPLIRSWCQYSLVIGHL